MATNPLAGIDPGFAAMWKNLTPQQRATAGPYFQALNAQQKVPGTTNGIPNGLVGEQRDAYVALQSVLQQWGLQSLAPSILNYVKQGYNNDTISFLIQQTPEYKQRFSANDKRVANGLAPLSPSDYLAVERSYRQVLQSNGLPAGFYDSPSDFTNMIAADISPSELNDRAQHAFNYVNQIDPQARAEWQAYYGVDAGHLAAYFLDPKQAQAVIDRQSAAVDIGAAAKQQGLFGPNRQTAERYADLGISQQQAQQAYQKVASVLPEESNIAARYGQKLGETDLAEEFVGGLASAARKRKQLNDLEQSQFTATNSSTPGSFGLAAGGGGY